MGRVPADWEDVGRFSPSGYTAADGPYATLEPVWDMEVPSPGLGNV